MKKYILLFFLLSLLPCLSTACSDDDGSSTPNLTVGKETVDFNSESGSQNVAVTTNVDTWTVKSDKNWCHPSADGKALLISCLLYTSKWNKFALTGYEDDGNGGYTYTTSRIGDELSLIHI